VSLVDHGDGTATLSGTPLVTDAGSYTISLIASNGVVPDATQSFTLAIGGPVVTTNPASDVFNTRATLNGTVNANFASSAITFEYGLTTTYGSKVTATPATLTGATNTAVSATLNGLTPNTLYHFRVKAVNSNGATFGSDLTFSTLNLTITLEIHDAAHTPVASATLGDNLHAAASFTGSGLSAPTGFVSFTR
jgi:phosphodiesterase/alkaline phosphatase D-like protein